MSRFLNDTLADLRSGRETWRVLVLLGSPAFAAALANALVQF